MFLKEYQKSKSTILKTYNRTNTRANVISLDSLNSDGVLEIIGNSKILSIVLIQVYDGLGDFNSFDDLYFDTELAPLQIVLSDFQLENIEYSKVEIYLQTASENNTNGFEIEKRKITI